jgi:hypothetical protein
VEPMRRLSEQPYGALNGSDPATAVFSKATPQTDTKVSGALLRRDAVTDPKDQGVALARLRQEQAMPSLKHSHCPACLLACLPGTFACVGQSTCRLSSS